MRTRIAAAVLVAALGTAAVAVAAGRSGGAPVAAGDPAELSSKRWRTLEPSPLERTEVAAARVGRFIYVVGGFLAPGGETTDKTARYDIRRDRWKMVEPMPIAVNHPAAAASGGKVYVHGGFANATGLADATPRLFGYDPRRDRWTELPAAAVPRAAHALVAIDGRLYAAGGTNSGSDQLASLEIYDIQAAAWSPGADMATGRNHIAGATVGGDFYVMGGRPPFNLSVVERYDPQSNTWATVAPLNTARSGFAAAAVGGRIVAFGGEAGATIAPVEVYDPAANAWSGLPEMRTPRHGLGGASKGRRVYALEGGPEPGFAFSRVLEFLDVR
jgi:N-acetylneuraminic acid mutarotase